MKPVNFGNITQPDLAFLKKCVARAKILFPTLESEGLLMDIWAVHRTLPLNFEGLLHATNIDFGHDIVGIHNHLDRESKKLATSFCPRFARSQSAVFVINVTVPDPCSNSGVEIAIYKDMSSGAFFGIDGDYLKTLSEGDPVSNPFTGRDIHLIDEEIKMKYSELLSDFAVVWRNSCD